MQRTRNLIILILSFFALGFSGWLYVHNQSQERVYSISDPWQADAEVQSIQVKQFDSSGKISELMTTPKLKHYPQQNTSVFETPYIVINRPNQPPWKIHAKQGKAIAGDQHIILLGKVVIQQAADAKEPATDITTEELSFIPKQRLALTAKPIALHQPGIDITAIGMEAHMEQRQVHLISHAKIAYHPDERRRKS